MDNLNLIISEYGVEYGMDYPIIKHGLSDTYNRII